MDVTYKEELADALDFLRTAVINCMAPANRTFSLDVIKDMDRIIRGVRAEERDRCREAIINAIEPGGRAPASFFTQIIKDLSND